MQLKRQARWNKTLPVSGVAALAAALIFSPSADAQEAFDARTFQPGAGPYNVFSIERADTMEHLQYSGAAIFDYLSQPLVLKYEDGESEPVIDQQFATHLIGGLGMLGDGQLELALPLYFLNDGAFQGEDLSGAAVGDVSLRGKYRFLSSQDGPVGIGAMLDLRLPTGSTAGFVGESGLVASPSVIADTRFATPIGDALVAANLGFRFKEGRTVHDIELGSEMAYGLGAQVNVIANRLDLGLELYGKTQLGDFFAKASSPLEAILGAKIHARDGFSILAGTGGGLVGGVGAPEFRAFVGLTYAHPMAAAELIVEAEESPCPDAPADYDGPVDDDGCPVEFVEEAPSCDNLVEGWDGPVDEAGCPILDRDGDGIVDADDKCPDVPGDFVEGQEPDGCPQADTDGDGIVNVDDDCPEAPGLEQYKGCPPPVQKAVREKDQIRILEKIFFETDKAIIKQDSYELLDQVGLILRTNPDIRRIEIAGHTDRRGDADYNRMLSEERAKSVRQYLIDRAKVSADRLLSVGYGSQEPLEQGDTDEAFAKNRRVEFRIVEQDPAPAAKEEVNDEAKEAEAEDKPEEPADQKAEDEADVPAGETAEAAP